MVLRRAGQVGFPNLTDTDWFYGGSRGSHSAYSDRRSHGRYAGQRRDAQHARHPSRSRGQLRVEASSGRPKIQRLLKLAKAVFMQACTACHGVDGKGMQALGFAPPDLQRVALYGSTFAGSVKRLVYGRQNKCPRQRWSLSQDQIQHLAA